MGSHGRSRKSLLFPNFSPKRPAKSCQVIGIHGQSCQVRGILRTKGGVTFIRTTLYFKIKLLLSLGSDSWPSTAWHFDGIWYSHELFCMGSYQLITIFSSSGISLPHRFPPYRSVQPILRWNLDSKILQIIISNFKNENWNCLELSTGPQCRK